MKYSVFLSDFDGTLVRGDGTISDKNKEAIARYRAAGGIFAVCTGRMLSSILPRLHELGLEEGLVVAYQGATIADIKTGALLKNDHFSEEAALRVLRLLEAQNLHIHAYTVEQLYANRDDEWLHIYEKVCGVKGRVCKKPLSDMVASEHAEIVKILVMDTPERVQELHAELSQVLGEEFFVTRSSEWMVEVMPAAQNKAAAVDFLSEYYDLPRERIAAIGDQLNDLPMLERAGGKFAVGNAAAALKEHAIVVPSCEEDGVATAISDYVMGDLQ